jgi:hypothetical protein
MAAMIAVTMSHLQGTFSAVPCFPLDLLLITNIAPYRLADPVDEHRLRVPESFARVFTLLAARACIRARAVRPRRIQSMGLRAWQPTHPACGANGP